VWTRSGLRDWTALYTPFFSVRSSVDMRYHKAYKEFHYCIGMSKGHCGRITAKEYAKGRGKNPCGKTVSVDEPYEIYKDERSGFEWRVLKKYQTPHLIFSPLNVLPMNLPKRKLKYYFKTSANTFNCSVAIGAQL